MPRKQTTPMEWEAKAKAELAKSAAYVAKAAAYSAKADAARQAAQPTYQGWADPKNGVGTRQAARELAHLAQDVLPAAERVVGGAWVWAVW